MLFFVFVQLKQSFITYQMKERLEEENVQTITLNKNQVNWVEEGKELIIDGEMFDVKSYTQKNDSLVISGLFDKAEKALKDKLASVLGNQKNNDAPLQQLIAQFLNPIILTQNSVQMQTIVLLSTPKKYFISTHKFSSTTKEISTPPPNYI